MCLRVRGQWPQLLHQGDPCISKIRLIDLHGFSCSLRVYSFLLILMFCYGYLIRTNLRILSCVWWLIYTSGWHNLCDQIYADFCFNINLPPCGHWESTRSASDLGNALSPVGQQRNFSEIWNKTWQQSVMKMCVKCLLQIDLHFVPVSTC